MKYLLLLCCSFILSAQAATHAALEKPNSLYRIDLVRATPGHLEQVIESIKIYQDKVNSWPYMMRHSQGDHWDLMLIWPIENYKKLHQTEQYSLIRSLYSNLKGKINFQQSTYMMGPDTKLLAEYYNANKLYHIEMFVALADKKEELIKERQMESQYLINIKRKPNLLFIKEQGANWDAMTIGFYGSLKEFSTMADVPLAEDDKAARDAGFKGVASIGFYLRSLLQSHNDTLAIKP